jgi:hypothetical protein
LILTPTRYRHAKQEGDEQAGKRGFTRYRGDRRERFTRLSGFVDDRGQPIDTSAQAADDFADCLGDVSCDVNGALGHAGLRGGLRNFRAQVRELRSEEVNEAGTFGYPRER